MHTTKFNNANPNTSSQKLFWGLSKDIFLKTLLLAIVGICVLVLISCLDPNANGDLDDGTNGDLDDDTNGDLDDDTNGDLDDDTNGDGKPKAEGIIITSVAGISTFAGDTLTILPDATLAKTRITTLDPENNASMVKVMDVSVHYSDVDNIKGMLFVTGKTSDVDKVFQSNRKEPIVYANHFYQVDGDFFTASSSSNQDTANDDGVILRCRGKMEDATIECYLMRRLASALSTGDKLDIDFSTYKFGFIGGLPTDFDKAFNVATLGGIDNINSEEATTMAAANGIRTAELPFTVDGSITTGN